MDLMVITESVLHGPRSLSFSPVPDYIGEHIYPSDKNRGYFSWGYCIILRGYFIPVLIAMLLL